MTLEDFAHRCLMIKAGNAELAIPCCANCKYYEEALTANVMAHQLNKIFDLLPAKVVSTVESDKGVEIFCETTNEFISEKEAEQIHSDNVSESVQHTYECHHPEMTSQDYAVLTMAPEDFCSRWEERNGSN